jgi:hypothetical protein
LPPLRGGLERACRQQCIASSDRRISPDRPSYPPVLGNFGILGILGIFGIFGIA